MEHLENYQTRYNQFLQLHQLLSAYSGLYEKTKLNLVGYKAKAHYWEKQFQQIKTREGMLKEELEEIKAQLRKREQQIFGKKLERRHKQSEHQTNDLVKRNRGQQNGKPGHCRRKYNDLPLVEEEIDFLEQDKCCTDCGLPYEELSSTEDSEILEIINIKAYRRIIRRKKYRCELIASF